MLLIECALRAMLFRLSLAARRTAGPALRPATRPALLAGERRQSASTVPGEPPAPVTLIVAVEIEERRTPAFLNAMAVDAAGSREEPGCFTFDLLQDKSDPQKFYFYEMYANEEAIAAHRETPHFKAWAQFKAEGGVLSQTVIKADAIDHSYD